MAFQKGVVSNPNGRPKGSKNKIARLRQSVMQAYSVDDIRSVLEALYKQAMNGDIMATKAFLEYVIPKADKCIDMAIEEDKPELTSEQVLAIMKIIETDKQVL